MCVEHGDQIACKGNGTQNDRSYKNEVKDVGPTKNVVAK